MAKSVPKLEILAAGYFLGHWEPLLEEIKKIPSYKNPTVWKYFSSVSHSTTAFQHQDKLVSDLIALGIDTMKTPSELRQAIKANSYSDDNLKLLGI